MSVYHDWKRLLSCNGLIYIAEGTRQVGKSFPMRARAILRHIRTGEAVFWSRRTETEVDQFVSTFPGPKWERLCRYCGIELKQLRMKNGTLQFQREENGSWAKVMRFGSISRWNSFRDTDDPKETLLYLDEAFATVAKTRAYGGNEVNDALDLFRTLRHEDDSRMRMLVAGNPDRACNLWLDYFGIRRPKIRSGIVALTPTVNGGEFGKIWYEYIPPHGTDALDRLLTGTEQGAFLQGQAKGTDPRLIASIPPGSQWYCNFDFGGFLSVWRSGDYMIFSRSYAPGPVFRNRPDGGKDTLLFTADVRKRLVLLRNAWAQGRVRFASDEAMESAADVVAKII